MQKEHLYSEIFHSIQGEGFYTGYPTLWLRLWACNLQCHGFGQKDPADPSTWIVAPEGNPWFFVLFIASPSRCPSRPAWGQVQTATRSTATRLIRPRRKHPPKKSVQRCKHSPKKSHRLTRGRHRWWPRVP